MTTPISGSTVVQQLGYTPTDTANTTGQTLDKNAFLQLLVTQLRNQDPSAPMDSNTLMAQQTQMATMEQITSLADITREAFALQQRGNASALIGRTVSYTDAQGTNATGKVTSVAFPASGPTVEVNGTQVALDAVTAVTETAAATTA